MRKISLSILPVLLVLTVNAQTWVNKASVPGGGQHRDGGFSFAINNKVYVGGGFYNKDFHEYDPVANTWAPKKDIPASISSWFASCGFSINGKGYVVTGAEIDPGTFNSAEQKTVWEYDPGSDNWTKKKDIPGNARGSAACFVLNNKAYIVGGIDNNNALLNEVWEYDPASDKWTQKADFPKPNIHHACGFAVNSKGYIVCGVSKSGSTSEYLKSTYEYDATADTWTQKADIPGTKRANAVAFSIEQTGFIGLGNDFNGSQYEYQSDFYAYDPYTDTWSSAITNFPAAGRGNLVASSVNGKAYIGTGFTYVSGTSTYYNDWYELSHPASVKNVTRQVTSLQYYPNPATNTITINTETKDVYYYSMHNLAGQQIKNGMVPVNNSININELVSGQYILEVHNATSIKRAMVNVVK